MRTQLNTRATALLVALACAAGTSLAARAQPPIPGGGMAVKPVICRPVDAAKGKSGAELAAAVESQALEMDHNGYVLSALLPGDVPVACYRSRYDSSRLPRGAR